MEFVLKNINFLKKISKPYLHSSMISAIITEVVRQT